MYFNVPNHCGQVVTQTGSGEGRWGAISGMYICIWMNRLISKTPFKCDSKEEKQLCLNVMLKEAIERQHWVLLANFLYNQLDWLCDSPNQSLQWIKTVNWPCHNPVFGSYRHELCLYVWSKWMKKQQ